MSSSDRGESRTLELIILDGSDRRFPLPEGSEVTVGASARCTIRLDAPDVSRRHALLTLRNGRLTLLDLGSTNGTFVNGKPVEEQPLEVGDCVRFSSVLARVVPAGERLSSPGMAVIPDEEAPSSPGSLSALSSAGQPMAVILQESIVHLLRSWTVGESSALGRLAEWIVSHRGHRGVVFLEPAAADMVVLAAYGDIEDILKQPARLRRLEGLDSPAEAGVENRTLETDSGKVVAIRARCTPWLVLRVGIGMPDTLETELYARLMAVARQLDAAAPDQVTA